MAYYAADQPYYNYTAAKFSGVAATYRVGYNFGATGITGAVEYWVNKVWDPGGGGGWVKWTTSGAPDPTGASYPDPWGTGFGGCSDYRVSFRYHL